MTLSDERKYYFIKYLPRLSYSIARNLHTLLDISKKLKFENELNIFSEIDTLK